MIGIIVTLDAFCIILLIVLCNQDEKNATLTAENGLLKGRMENIRDNDVYVSDATRA